MPCCAAKGTPKTLLWSSNRLSSALFTSPFSSNVALEENRAVPLPSPSMAHAGLAEHGFELDNAQLRRSFSPQKLHKMLSDEWRAGNCCCQVTIRLWVGRLQSL